MFILYNVLLTLFSPIWLPWMWFRAKARREPPNWAERFGNYDLKPRKDRKRIWFHAVSVGEIVAAMPILSEIRTRLPGWEVVLSVTTSSGHQTARDKAAGLFDHLVYFPVDIPRSQLAAMQRVQPAVVAVMETELWMNFLWAAKVFDARTLLVNGRISDRSYRRSHRVAFFYRGLLKQMDRCLMQTEKDAERIRELGGQNVEVFGNCKFDQALAGLDADPALWRKELGLVDDLPVIVVGSTRGEIEERFVLEALQGVEAQFVHAPRHLERAAPLAEQVRERFDSVALRSKAEHGRYLILDSYGELDKVYSVADLVIVGGGFDHLGGQNLLQPLALGKPVLHGPHMHNFREVAAAAIEAGASRVCSTPQELNAAVTELLGNPTERGRMGAAASELVTSNAGASVRYAEAVAAEAKAFKS